MNGLVSTNQTNQSQIWSIWLESPIIREIPVTFSIFYRRPMGLVKLLRWSILPEIYSLGRRTVTSIYRSLRTGLTQSELGLYLRLARLRKESLCPPRSISGGRKDGTRLTKTQSITSAVMSPEIG